MAEKQIVSFVLRFHQRGVNTETNEELWRIKVTYVQENEEFLFEKLEDAVDFIKKLTNYS